MLGTSNNQATAGAAVNLGSLVGGSAQLQAQYGENSTNTGSISKAPALLFGVIALYLIWAVVVQKEEIREQLSLSNVAVNLHNLIVVGLTAMVFLLMGKIITAKAVIVGLPGASWVAQLFQAV